MMSINTLNFLNIRSTVNTRTHRSQISPITEFCKPRLQQHDTVNFTGKTDLIFLSDKDINAALSAACTPENQIGRGGEGTVYKIPDTDYCVKILKSSEHLSSKHWSTQLSEIDRHNHIVAKSDNGSVIMKKINGHPLSLKKTHNDTEIYSLPVESYRSYLIQLNNAYKAGLSCDTAPKNTIFDPDTKSLTQIDFYQQDNYFDNGNQTLRNAYTTLQQMDNDKTSQAQNRQLALNIMQAALEDLKPQQTHSANISVENQILPEDMDFNSLFAKLAQSQSERLPNQYTFLKEALNSATTLKYRLNRNFDNETLSQLNVKIKIAESLIKQLKREEYK